MLKNLTIFHKLTLMILVWLLALAFFVTAVTASTWFFTELFPAKSQLQLIQQQKTLRVTFRHNPLSYYENDGEANGLEYNLLTAFAAHINVSLEAVTHRYLEQQLDSLNDPLQNIHIAAASLSITEERRERFQFSVPYLVSTDIIVQHKKHPTNPTFAEILQTEGELAFIAGSTQAKQIEAIDWSSAQLKKAPVEDAVMFQLLTQVQDSEIYFAAVDSLIFNLERAIFPRLEVVHHLSLPSPVGLAMKKSDDRSLADALNSFIELQQQSGELDLLKNAYFIDQEQLDQGGSVLFKNRIKHRLLKYQELIKTVASDNNYDWLLLAAQAYQESHWQANARSVTGVRGLMMLTQPTAKQLGVTNRLDAEQSLRGGVKYMLSITSRLPKDIAPEDRIKFALGAYNIGLGHITDARKLTASLGDDPNSWNKVASHLPKLQQEKHYSKLKYGYARGSEAVKYVKNIMRFKSILDWYTWYESLAKQPQLLLHEQTEKTDGAKSEKPE